MNILQKQNNGIKQIAGTQRFDIDELYKESPYLVKESFNGKIAIFNCFTREAISMNDEEYANQFNSANEYLVSRWYFIPERWDAPTWQESFEQLYRHVEKKDRLSGLKDYIILPTLGCNANCPYCFQSGEKKTIMSEETADAVIEYIWKTFFGKIHLRWFGGEPLTNAPIITRICDSLRKRNVNFESIITTNGLLFNQTDIDVINDVWRLGGTQITLDGTRDYYNKIKSWKNPNGNEFERVLTNIEMLAANDINVSIRLNVSKSNEYELMALIDILHDRFNGNERIMAYPHILFGDMGENPVDYTDDDYEELYRICKKVQLKLVDYGLRNFPTHSAIKLSNCMADDLSSVCISPNGSLTLCESYTDDTEHVIGTVFDDNLDKSEINRWWERYHCNMCAECKIRPLCTRIKSCPARGCTTAEIEYEEWRIRQFLRKASNQ